MCSKHVFWVGIFYLINISSRYTRGNLSSPALLSLTSVYVPFSMLTSSTSSWNQFKHVELVPISHIILLRPPCLGTGLQYWVMGRPILCAAEVWRYGSGRALPNNLSKISDQSLLSVCIGIGGATGYWRLLEEPSSSCHIMETLQVGLLIFFENDRFYFVFWSFSKMFVSFYKKKLLFFKRTHSFWTFRKRIRIAFKKIILIKMINYKFLYGCFSLSLINMLTIINKGLSLMIVNNNLFKNCHFKKMTFFEFFFKWSLLKWSFHFRFFVVVFITKQSFFKKMKTLTSLLAG